MLTAECITAAVADRHDLTTIAPAIDLLPNVHWKPLMGLPVKTSIPACLTRIAENNITRFTADTSHNQLYRRTMHQSLKLTKGFCDVGLLYYQSNKIVIKFGNTLSDRRIKNTISNCTFQHAQQKL